MPVVIPGQNGRTVVISKPTTARITTQNPGVVVRSDPSRSTIVDRPTNLNVLDRRQPVVLRQPGNPGKDGRDGHDATGAIPVIGFAYNESSRIIHTETVAGTYTRARIDFDTAFDAGDVSIGFVGDVEALIAIDENDPTLVASFDIVADIHVAANTAVWLQIDRDGATRGNGRIYLEFSPD